MDTRTKLPPKALAGPEQDTVLFARREGIGGDADIIEA